MTGSVPADHIHIKPHDVGAPSDVHQMEWQEIMEILHNLDDVGMVDAANDFHHLAHSLRRIAYQIAQHGKELARDWKGGAADTALARFEELYQYTSSLSTQAKQTGNALAWLGYDVLPHYKNLQSPTAAVPKEEPGSGGAPVAAAASASTASAGAASAGSVSAGAASAGAASAGGFSPAGQTAANEAAREYLRSLSGHIQAANDAIPTTITGTPVKKKARKPPAKHTPPPGKNPPTKGGPIGPIRPPRATPIKPPRFPVQPPVTSPTPPPGGTLQSTGPAGTSPMSPAAGGAAGPGVAGGSGAGAGGSGMTMPVGVVPSASTGAADSADPAGAGEAGEKAMMPMAPGGGSGSEERERWRRSHTDEDDDLWGVPVHGTEAVIE